ncbi:MAG: FIST C-terminal domain-containing protein [Burkholderiaceae bacterium]|nr:FIST C-terminal domain-containing protein [Burkholderiaceae bacterium]
MKTQQIQVNDITTLSAKLAAISDASQYNLLLVFGAPKLLKAQILFAQLQEACPTAIIVGCSTAGEITSSGIADDTLVVTLSRFDKVTFSVATTDLKNMDDSENVGRSLGASLHDKNPSAVIIFGQGVNINGSALIDGLRAELGHGVAITGGLAGDGTRFQETLVVTPQGVSSTAVVAVGLSGSALRFNHGSFGGWEPFGTLRKVTRAAGNVLFELDGTPALDIYKKYLGDYAKDLPASGLLFPFEMLNEARNTTGVIRTILAVDESNGSLTLAGDIDPNGFLRLMHASSDRLVAGAEVAANAAKEMTTHPEGGIGLLVSCVGRKLVMGDRIDEEIEAVGNVFGSQTVLTGFYSYGEISPFAPGAECRLHNQTMTVTWINESP